MREPKVPKLGLAGSRCISRGLGQDCKGNYSTEARAEEPKGEALPYGGGYMTEEEYKRPGGFGDLKADLKEAENG